MADDRGTAATPTAIDEIRAALRRHIAETTLRGTASDLGMSPSGLRSFADGREAFGPTVRRARAWFARWALDQGQTAVADENALEILLGPLPQARRNAAMAECRRLLEQLRRPAE